MNYTLDKYKHAVTENGDTTDPYGSLLYCIGDNDDFICFDYLELGDKVAIHSVLNSETGSFIMDFSYSIVDKDVCLFPAMEMVGEAISWCGENEVEFKDKGHVSCFLNNIAKLCGLRLSEADERFYSNF